MIAIVGMLLGCLAACVLWMLLCGVAGLDSQGTVAGVLFFPLYFGFGFAGLFMAFGFHERRQRGKFERWFHQGREEK